MIPAPKTRLGGIGSAQQTDGELFERHLFCFCFVIFIFAF